MPEAEPTGNTPHKLLTGGTDVMKKLSRELKDGEQSAIVVLERDKRNSRFRGYISFKKGDIIEALYKESGTDGKSDSKSGKDALRRVWKEALDPSATMKIYSVMPKDGELQEMKEIENEQTKEPAGTKRIRKLKEDNEMPGPGDGEWKDEETDATPVVKPGNGSNEASALYLEYEAKIKRLRSLEKSLEDLKGRGFDDDYTKLLDMVKDPERISELELGIGLLKRKIESGATPVVPKYVPAPTVRRQTSDYEDMYSAIFGSTKAVTQEGRCRNCGAKLSGRVCDICGHSALLEWPGSTGLNQSMQFSNFVVGSGNKFAHAACISMTNAATDHYNPLYIHSATGLGKTHLLNAIGNQALAEKRNSSVLYLGTDKFIEEVGGLGSVTADTYAASLKKLDLLLLDDVQFLSGKDVPQELLLNVINSMLRDGKNVVVAGDRHVKDIKGIERQLASRLEAGLTVDMHPPDMETRMKILEMKVKEEKYEMPPSVVKYIAETVENNIRELTGSLNRVVAYSTLMKIPPTIESAKRILRTNQPEPKKDGGGGFELRPGHGYIIEEDRADLCHRLLQDKLQEDWTVLDVTRVNPTRLRMKYPGLEKARVVWLTDRESDREITLQPSLEKIEYEIKSFMESASRGSGKAIVNIDDLQYVISNTNFEGTVRLLRRMVDEMSERNSVLIISVGRDTLAKQEIAILERELELIQ